MTKIRLLLAIAAATMLGACSSSTAPEAPASKLNPSTINRDDDTCRSGYMLIMDDKNDWVWVCQD